jgi:hypothetical protein
MPIVASATVRLPLSSEDSWYLPYALGVVSERGYDHVDGIGRWTIDRRGLTVWFLLPDATAAEQKALIEQDVSNEIRRVLIVMKDRQFRDAIAAFRALEDEAKVLAKLARATEATACVGASAIDTAHRTMELYDKLAKLAPRLGAFASIPERLFP